jgi:hypothetical protein
LGGVTAASDIDINSRFFMIFDMANSSSSTFLVSSSVQTSVLNGHSDSPTGTHENAIENGVHDQNEQPEVTFNRETIMDGVCNTLVCVTNELC